MSGMSGLSGMNGMSKSCGMEGMHGNGVKKQLEKVQDTQSKQNDPSIRVSDGIRGQKIDIGV